MTKLIMALFTLMALTSQAHGYAIPTTSNFDPMATFANQEKFKTSQLGCSLNVKHKNQEGLNKSKYLNIRGQIVGEQVVGKPNQ